MTESTDADTTDAEPTGPPARRTRRTGIVPAAVVAVVLVAGVATIVVRRAADRPSTCASLPTSLADTDGVTTIRPDDVLLHVSSSNAMSGMGAPTVVLDRSGNVLALDAWTQTGATYRRARLDEASLTAWTSCLESAEFRELSNDHTSQQSEPEDGRFCAVSDSSETALAAGPASSAVKVVRVYHLSTAGSPAAGCIIERPRAITDLGGSAAVLRTSVSGSGAPAAPPDAALMPA